MVSEVSLYEAKTHLSSLVDRVSAGEELVITKNGVPKAKLSPLKDGIGPREPAGALGVSEWALDFDEPNVAIASLFEGSDEAWTS